MPKKQVGFTVLELIVTMTIAAILLSVGIPSFINTIRTNRLASATNEMVSALMYARSEAVKRNLPVILCRSSNGTSCAASGTGGWEIGWIVYVDGNCNGSYDPSGPHPDPAGTCPTLPAPTASPPGPSDIILNVHEAMNSSIWTRGNNNVANNVSFDTLGMARTNTGALAMGALTVTFGGVTSNSNNMRLLCIASSGRPRLMPKTYVPTTCTSGACDCTDS